MPVVEHPVQPLPDNPAEQYVTDRATTQFILHAVDEACLAAGVVKFVPVDPLGEGSLDLLVFEQNVPLECSMQRDPGEYSYTQFHARTGLDAPSPPDHPHSRECRRQQQERILPLVKAEDGAYGRIDEHGLDERRHIPTLLWCILASEDKENTHMKILLALALSAMALSLNAATVTYVDHDKVAAALSKGGPLVTAPDLLVQGSHRDKAGQVELHEKETDVIHVIDGEATFVTGGTMVGRKLSKPGQLVGSDIKGGETHHLTKGDVIVVPAGTPHWFKEVPSSISYYVVKVLKP
jgi:mannose-6-phosphate isomerase-like protein (cupin superfamily)